MSVELSALGYPGEMTVLEALSEVPKAPGGPCAVCGCDQKAYHGIRVTAETAHTRETGGGGYGVAAYLCAEHKHLDR